MNAALRLRLAGGLAGAAEVVLGVLLAGTVLAPYFWVTAALTVAVTQVAGRFMVPPAGPSDGHGGGGEEPEPPWWPEFERALQAHVRDGSPGAPVDAPAL